MKVIFAVLVTARSSIYLIFFKSYTAYNMATQTLILQPYCWKIYAINMLKSVGRLFLFHTKVIKTG